MDTSPANLTETTIVPSSGVRVTTFPDGGTDTFEMRPDFRFGLQAPVFTRTIRMPSGKTLTRQVTRTGTLNGSNNLDLATATESVVVNGRTPAFQRTYVKSGSTRTITSTTAEGRPRQWTLDAKGRVVSDAPDSGLGTLDPILNTYDPGTELLATVSQGASGATRTFALGYDAKRRLALVTDPLMRQFILGYDSADRVTSLTLPGGRVIGIGYDPNGNVTSLLPPATGTPPTHTFVYSPVDLPSGYTPPAVTGTGATTSSYNDDRQLELITRPDGQTIELLYDGTTGRVSTLAVPNGSNTYNYYANGPGAGRVSSMATTIPLTAGLTFTYDGSLVTQTEWLGLVPGVPPTVAKAYDSDFRVQQSTVSGGNAVAFQYDKDDLVTQAGAATLVRGGPQGLVSQVTVGNVVETRSYNSFGELRSIIASSGSTSLLNLTYDSSTAPRDKLGRIVQVTETIGNGSAATTAYGYNLAGQLEDVSRDGVPVAPHPAYTYDPNGNRQTAPGLAGTPDYDDQDRLRQYNGATYDYTANGELLRKTVGSAITDYEYDVLGNLRSVTLPDSTHVEYVIDGDNRRVGKRINDTLVQAWLYDDELRVVAELDATGSIVSRFVYASRPTVPDYMVNAGSTYRLIADQLGSVRLVVDALTGATVQRLDYDEFGRVTSETGTVGFQPFGFAGGIYDRDTGLVRFGARDYNSAVGRWTSKDQIDFAGGDTNLYVYAFNDPTNVTDPEGTVAGVDDAVLIGGGALGAAILGKIIQGSPAYQEGAREFFDSLRRQEAKGGKQNVKDSEFENKTDQEVHDKARDRSLDPGERRRYQKEEKARKLRNKGKRCP